MDNKTRYLGKGGREPRIFKPRVVRALGAPIGRGDFPNVVQQGATAHFRVYYDPALGATGVTIANGVLAACERDYNTISGYFGGITPPGLPFNVVIVDLTNATVGACGGPSPAGGGAYHCDCAAVDLYCDIKTAPAVDPSFTEFLNVAEFVEVFEAAQGQAWDCGASNGDTPSPVGLRRRAREGKRPTPPPARPKRPTKPGGGRKR